IRVQFLAHRVEVEDRVVSQLVPALGAEEDGLPVGAGELRGGGEDHLPVVRVLRSEEHTSELQSRFDLVCRLLLEKKKKQKKKARKRMIKREKREANQQTKKKSTQHT